MTNFSIHIATDQPDPIRKKYMIAILKWHWERAGHRVTTGLANDIDADVGILHMDRTKIDQNLLPENSSHRPFLNERVLDISKSQFSTLRVMAGDSWDGPVIIKSNLNCYGGPEWKRNHHSFFERIRRQLAQKSWRLARMLSSKRYPVLPKLSNVPGWVWERPELIVERFMPERERGLYCLRGWVFFGKRGYTYRLFSRDSVVKAGNMTEYEILGDPPPELEAFREANGFDFGKFDYVEVAGRPILLDINKTPTIVFSNSAPDTPRMRHLADGLYDFTGAS
ncbi:MAG: hypothetical protein WAL98_19380 [Desulfatiglandaceae bacterium]